MTRIMHSEYRQIQLKTIKSYWCELNKSNELPMFPIVKALQMIYLLIFNLDITKDNI